MCRHTMNITIKVGDNNIEILFEYIVNDCSLIQSSNIYNVYII